jgi:hypothetical protein
MGAPGAPCPRTCTCLPVLICRFVLIANAIENQFFKMIKATRQELKPCRMVQWFA